MKPGFLYIMTNRRNGTLYIGVTSILPQRVYQHRNGVIPGFTQRHGLKMLSITKLMMIFAMPFNARRT
jgi:putative endonuclease